MLDKRKLNNYGMWVAIVAQIVIILQVTGVLSVTEIELVNTVTMAVLQILVLAGILNNPSNGTGYKG